MSAEFVLLSQNVKWELRGRLVTSEMQRRDLFQTEVAREAQLEVASLGKRYISQFLSSKSFSNNERGKQFAFLLLR